MNIHLTEYFQKKVRKLCQKDRHLAKQFTQQLALFQQNPQHPSLKLHKLQGKRSEQYAVWIKANLRALSIWEGDTIVFFDLITHDQY